MIEIPKLDAHPTAPTDTEKVLIYMGPDGEVYVLGSDGIPRSLSRPAISPFRHLHAMNATDADKLHATGWSCLNAPGSINLAGAITLNDDHIYYVPAVPPRTITIEEFAVYVDTAVTGGTQANQLRAGLYANARDASDVDRPAKFPEDLISEFGTLDMTSTGEKKITGLSLVLEEGRLYWWALGADINGTCQIRSLSESSAFGIGGLLAAWNIMAAYIDDFVDTSSNLPADASAALPGSTVGHRGPFCGVRFS